VKKTKAIVAGAAAFFWIAAGLLACYGATRLGLGSVTEPGAGFIFFWSGVVLVILSLVVLIDSIRSSEAAAHDIGEMNWIKITLVLVSLVLYAFFLEKLGFILTTFFLLSFLLSCIEDTNWIRSLGVAGVAAMACYAIFELWLKIRLPKGLFGF